MSTKHPVIVLVTGVSGAGKTAIAKQLNSFGQRAISLDGYPGLCTWADRHMRPVQRRVQPTLPWLQDHRWIWMPEVLDALIDDLHRTTEDVVWLTGVAANTTALADRFDLRILLRLDQATMLQRVHSPTRSNSFGRAGASAQLLRQRFHHDQQALARICDTAVDATTALEDVGRALLIELGMALLRHNRTT